MDDKGAKMTKLGGLLIRLRNNVRGNVLILTAAALIPLIGMVGAGIDLSRLYLVRARLQHACDAGALAGRKAMGAGSWTQTSPNPPTIANQFFDGNFKADGLASTNLIRNYSANGGLVTGNAQVDVPMTVMKFFGSPTRTLSVTCATQQTIPNTDVMFVLDNTGSMACNPDGTNCNSSSTSKIAVLKNAVKCFYESVTQLTSNGDCPDSNSTGAGINNSAQVRFGFVPYTMDVNVGYLLPTSYFANTWKYQSRQWNASTGKWHYDQITTDISGLKNGTSWRTSLSLPLNSNGSSKTVSWNGCIEERTTVSQTSYSPIPAGARDLDIDGVPSQSDPNSLWAPSLPGAEYFRAVKLLNSAPYYSGNTSTAAVDTTDDYATGDDPRLAAFFGCPTAAKKLQTWATSDFDNYVDSLSANGNTYHDIGMLWGGRLMSPTGIFSSENATTPAGGAIQRSMVFMTDGDAQASPCNITAYGVAFYDKRQTTDTGSNLTDCLNESTALDNQVNARLAALCTAVKNKGINLYVVSFGGTGIAADTKARLQTCATDANHYFDATNSTQLNTAFKTIAAQITQLRLIQ